MAGARKIEPLVTLRVRSQKESKIGVAWRTQGVSLPPHE